MKSFVATILAGSLFMVGCGSAAPLRTEDEKVISGWGSIEKVRVSGIDCIVAKMPSIDGGIAISCDWSK